MQCHSVRGLGMKIVDEVSPTAPGTGFPAALALTLAGELMPRPLNDQMTRLAAPSHSAALDGG